jgi:hypothetical protein
MKIELLYFSGCPTYQETDALIEAAVRSFGVPAEVEVKEVKTPEDATSLRFLGSPTIRVDGIDIDPVARASADYGLKCRVYRSGNRFVGVPPRELLDRAIKEARNGQDCCASNG